MASGKGFSGFESGSNGDATLYNTLNASIARSGSRYLTIPMVGSPTVVDSNGTMTVSTLAMGGGAGFIGRCYVRNANIAGTGGLAVIFALGVVSVGIDSSGQIIAADGRLSAVVGTIPNDGAWHKLVVIVDQHMVAQPGGVVGSILGFPVTGTVYNFIGSGSQASSCVAASIDGSAFIGTGREDASANRTVNTFVIGNGGAGTGSVLLDDLCWAWSDSAVPTLPTNTRIYPISINAINTQTGWTGNLSDVQDYPKTPTGTSPPYYAAALESTSASAVATFGHPTHFSLVLGDVEAVKAVVFARRNAAGTASFDAKLGASTIASISSIPESNVGNELAPVGYNYTGWTAAAFDSLTFGITQTNAGVLALGSMMLEILAKDYEPIPPRIDTITPDSGPTTGGTVVTMTGVFNPTTVILFGQYGSALISVSETQIVVSTPRHPAGAEDVTAVTPVPGAATLFHTVPNGFTFVAPAPVGTITLDAARREPEVQISNQLGNGQNSFGFSVNGEDTADFEPGTTINMQLGTGDTISRGVLLQTTLTVEDSRFNERLDCSGNDNVWVLNAKLVKGTWDNKSASAVAKEVLNTFAPDFSSARVQEGLPNISLAFFLDANVGQVLDRICELLPNGHWYLDTDDVVHLFNGTESGTPVPDPLTDSNMNLRLAEFPIQVKTDISQIRNRVYVRGSGSPASTGYLPPVAPPQGDPGGADPWLWQGGTWGSLLETGGNIDTNRNTAGQKWYWRASYIFVWTTAAGNSLGGWTSRYPSPVPLTDPYTVGYITGSNQVALRAIHSSLDERITGLKIYREIQRAGPHALNAAAHGNIDLFSPNQDSGHGPFFLIRTATRADILAAVSNPFRHLDTASENTLVGGEMKKYSQLVGQDHTANIFAFAEDTVSQANLKARLGYGDGVRESLIYDSSITTQAQAIARAEAELDLWADPIVEITYATTDTKTKVGATVHVQLSNPAITGDFKIQQVRLTHIHDNDFELPVIVATASSVRFTLNDLFARVVLDSDGGGSRGSSLAGTSSANPSPSGSAATALQLAPGKDINGVLFNGSADISINAAPDHMNETPAGSVNSSNTVFTTAAAYKTGSLAVYLNGLRQKKTADYTETTSTTFTFTTAPTTGDSVCVDYQES